ncbi:hypothetical protein VNO77_23585 [Canavalia gladiata]|uniref:Uncharacterized protein n=1 Tax=Canavalia gladiata TaxID=3824 RepID=A0AAN9QFG8_CANGL
MQTTNYRTKQTWFQASRLCKAILNFYMHCSQKFLSLPLMALLANMHSLPISTSSVISLNLQDKGAMHQGLDFPLANPSPHPDVCTPILTDHAVHQAPTTVGGLDFGESQGQPHEGSKAVEQYGILGPIAKYEICVSH